MSEMTMQQAGRLHRLGRLLEAAKLYEQVLRENQRHVGALCSLGLLYLQSGLFEEAAKTLGAAAQIEPRMFDTWYHLSSAFYRTGRRDEALSCLERALALDPGNVMALTNRAAILLEAKRFDHALSTCDTVLAFDPKFVLALVNRGNALSALERHEDALASYEAALAIQPNLPEAAENRDSALFKLRRTSRCPPAFMRRLFDNYAGNYDEHMVETLRYRAHVHLRTLFERLFPKAKPPMRIVDLGSGTGLVGDMFKDMAKGGRLDGIDLAPQMIAAAKERKIYDDLILGDLETVLAAKGPTYDLALAADTMIYIGDLSPTFTGVAGRLEPGGHYIFAVEAKDGEGWEHTGTNRFRHSLSYMREEAAKAGLEFVDYIDCTLREEASGPIAGFTVALRRPANN